jgi:hypothetical protein
MWNSNFLRSLQRRGLSVRIGSGATRNASLCVASGINFLALGEKTKKSGRIINSSPARPQTQTDLAYSAIAHFLIPFQMVQRKGMKYYFN